MTMSWQLEAEAPVGRRGTPVRRHRLPNGLSLLSVIDRRAPIVAFQIWYHVGSRHERPGATGMAHLFEHLMFNQTENLPPGEFDRLVERIGGESNAATWVDWTHYRLLLPSRDLPLAVRLEAERMQHLVLDEKPVETERSVVTNERREYVEDDVDGWIDEQLMAHAFTVHPYRWPTLGWMEDIRSLPIEEMRTFYRTWYRPNNATLVCVGDFDEAALMDLVSTHFGHIAPATLPAITEFVEPEQTRERIVRAPKPIATDRLLMGYKVPGQGHTDWAALEIIATILAGPASARLYRKLVIERESASTVDVQLTPFRDPSLIRFSVTATRGHTADEILADIDHELARMIEQPPLHAEVEKAKAIAETEFWNALVDVDGKASQLGHYEVTLGDFRTLDVLAERLAEVTVDDVARCVRTYLRSESRTIVIAEPSSNDEADDELADD